MAKNKDICFYGGTMLITLFGIFISINHAATAVSLSGGTTKTTYCEFYNETMCTETRGQGCFEREVCQSQDPEKQDHCYVLWQTDNNGNMTLKLKGCFLNNIDCFNKSECVERAHKPKKDILLFCCCEGNMCNQNFTWDPAPTEAPKPHQIQPVEIDDQDNIIYFISLILVAFLFVIVMLILISYATCYKDKLPFIELPTTEAQLQCPGSPRSGPRAIQLLEVKARGRFGAVWKAQYLNEEVAVKIFPIQDKQSWVSEQEIFRLPHMLHPNILRLIGVERRGGDNLHAEFWLITAYHERGSLCDYLKANTLTWPQLCRIAESMARGLMHLHEEIPANKTQGYKPAVAHRDFKSKNVLLKSDMTACIADFGLALIFHPGQPCGDTHGQVGTRRYMAPEVLEGAINFTRDAFLRIDMYACGLVLWELASRCSTTAITGTAPDYRLPLEEDVGSHPTLEDMQDAVVQRKVRPSIPPHWKQHQGMSMLCDTMEECWDHDAEARLSASCVMERVALQRRCPTSGAPVSTPPITSCHPATPCVDPPLTV